VRLRYLSGRSMAQMCDEGPPVTDFPAARPAAQRRDLFPQGVLDEPRMAATLGHGVAAAARLGVTGLAPMAGTKHVLISETLVLRCQHYGHERLEVHLDFSRAAAAAGIGAPTLVACGQADSGTWWVLLSRVHGAPRRPGLPSEGFAELVGALSRLHAAPVSGSCRWGDPGAVGIFLGTLGRREPSAYSRMADRLWELTKGDTLTPIHGDAGLGHNTLWDAGGHLSGLIDPGAVSIGPPAVDFAWSVAMGVGDGHDADDLLRCVPAAHRDHVAELLPLMVRRHLCSARSQGDLPAGKFCRRYLSALGAEGRTWLRD